MSKSVSEELRRRLTIVETTWPDYLKSRSDAIEFIKTGRIILLSYAPLNYVERAYAAALDKRFGVEVEESPVPITDIHRWIYIYGFNSMIREFLLSKHKEADFWVLRSAIVRGFGFPDSVCRSEFFVPYRFAFRAANIDIQSYKPNAVGFDNISPVGNKADMEILHNKYLTTEGVSRRGDMFKSLAYNIGKCRFLGIGCSTVTVVDYLGQPDRKVKCGEVTIYEYGYYDSQSSSQAVVWVLTTNELIAGVTFLPIITPSQNGDGVSPKNKE
ncbi:MAG: hypothetical protein KKC51_06990 [Verrucomicrobia bacterium]|nr:hypothetical protein [Verrucomicrobiota bacterium]